jgi:hypothetical protein
MNTQSQMRALLYLIEAWLERERRPLTLDEQIAVCFAMMCDKQPRERSPFRFVQGPR